MKFLRRFLDRFRQKKLSPSPKPNSFFDTREPKKSGAGTGTVKKVSFLPGTQFSQMKNKPDSVKPEPVGGFFIKRDKPRNCRIRLQNFPAPFRSYAKNFRGRILLFDQIKRRHLKQKVTQPVFHYN